MALHRRPDPLFFKKFCLIFSAFFVFFSAHSFALDLPKDLPKNSQKISPQKLSPIVYENNSPEFSNFKSNKNSIWPEITQGFALNHELNNPRVQYFIHYDQAHLALIQDILNNAQEVLYPIVQAIKIRHLPMELALLPAVESGYRLNIESSSGAVGLWQLLPQTAQDYGVLVDSYWYDGREDFLVSTIAALNFLSDLNHQFNNDWFLSIAAYNSGETTVKNSINQNTLQHLPTGFFNLTLPNQTQDYVPKLLALAELVQHPQKYGLVLPSIPNNPEITQIYLTRQIDLATAAAFSHVSLNIINKLNSDLTHGILPNQGPSYLYLPAENTQRFEYEAAHHSYEQYWDLYEVEPGEFLSTIAKNHQISVSELEKINDLDSSDLQPHETLITPIYPSASFQSRQTDLLKPHQTLADFAKSHHMDLKDLLLINGLDLNNPPNAGSRLLIN